MNVVALGLHYGAQTKLYQEDPRSQNRDLGHPFDFLRRYVLKAGSFNKVKFSHRRLKPCPLFSAKVGFVFFLGGNGLVYSP
jgi:hypothetical protein